MKKEIGKKRLVFGILIIAALLIGAVVIATNSDIINNQQIVGDDDDDDYDPYSPDPYGTSKIPADLFMTESMNKTIDILAVNPVWNDITQDYRPRWKGATDEEFAQIFSELPKMPMDFYRKYKMFMDGQITDYDRLGIEYWSQPEFFGLDSNSFYTYNERWDNMWNIGQVSCKPSHRYVELKRGATVQLSTFVHTGVIGTEAYLGGVVKTDLPDACLTLSGQKVFDQPTNADKYISSKIISPGNDPIYESETFQNIIEGHYDNVLPGRRLLLFPATYRKLNENGEPVIYGFPSDWVKKVTLQIDIAEDCPPDNYIVSLDMENPSETIIQEYNWIISGSPYYSFFFPAIREWRPICPYFQVVITVV